MSKNGLPVTFSLVSFSGKKPTHPRSMLCCTIFIFVLSSWAIWSSFFSDSSMALSVSVAFLLFLVARWFFSSALSSSFSVYEFIRSSNVLFLSFLSFLLIFVLFVIVVIVVVCVPLMSRRCVVCCTQCCPLILVIAPVYYGYACVLCCMFCCAHFTVFPAKSNKI